jgi:hypothetical protein
MPPGVAFFHGYDVKIKATPLFQNQARYPYIYKK